VHQEKNMHSNRSTRNAQQLRSLIQNMGRSIDEARTRRLGPTVPQAPASPPARNEPAPKPQAQVQPQSPANAGNVGTPPIRSADEMFVEGGQRLTARPKRPN
jgi:hypothetical protein